MSFRLLLKCGIRAIVRACVRVCVVVVVVIVVHYVATAGRLEGKRDTEDQTKQF